MTLKTVFLRHPYVLSSSSRPSPPCLIKILRRHKPTTPINLDINFNIKVFSFRLVVNFNELNNLI